MEEELKLPEPVALFRCYESRDIAEVKVKSDLLGNGDALYTAEQVRQAVLAERERCARVCEARIAETGLPDIPGRITINLAKTMAQKCAAAIRKG